MQILKHRLFNQVAAAAIVITFAITAQAQGDNKAQKQQEVRTMCKDALALLYKEKPEMREKVSKAAGYGCFDSFGITLGVGGAGGSGLVHDNKTGKDVFMNMGQASVGLEIGVKDYREVLVFNDAATMKKFVDSGWEFSSNAEATGKHADKGVQKQATATSQYNTIDIYPMTETGLALGASVGGRKYWKSDTLN